MIDGRDDGYECGGVFVIYKFATSGDRLRVLSHGRHAFF